MKRDTVFPKRTTYEGVHLFFEGFHVPGNGFSIYHFFRTYIPVRPTNHYQLTAAYTTAVVVVVRNGTYSYSSSIRRAEVVVT